MIVDTIMMEIMTITVMMIIITIIIMILSKPRLDAILKGGINSWVNFLPQEMEGGPGSPDKNRAWVNTLSTSPFKSSAQ